MNKEPLFDIAAIAGKIAIEHTKLHPDAKFGINWGIDQVAEYLKEVTSTDLEKIRRAAKRFDIDKVIAVPFCLQSGQELIAIRVYGKNSKEFIRQLGIQLIPEKETNDFLKEMHEKEKLFGVLIYEKSN